MLRAFLLGAAALLFAVPAHAGFNQPVACAQLPALTGSATKPSGSCATASGRATNSQAPANPTGTANTTGLMMGLAGTITPTSSGVVLVIVNGDVTNGTASDAAKLQLRISSVAAQAAPANTAAASGTALGGFVQVTTSTNKIPFTLIGRATALTLNSAYWIDVQLAAVTGGTAAIADVTILAIEQ